MTTRFNLPYTTQDLFAQGPVSSEGPAHNRPGSSSAGLQSPHGAYNHPFTPRSSAKSFKKMLRRLFKPMTLDFETAMWEIFHLIINPRKMYRSQYYYKQHQNSSKNSYTRDDPSFLILLTTLLVISSVAWGLAYSPHPLDIIKLILYAVVIDFYLTGVVIATVSWLVTNRLFNKSFSFTAMRYDVNYIEWGFCFDIHCNSFLIIWCLLYLVQFILLPLISINNSFLSLLLGNTLYFGAVGYYFVITFYGFNSLPFINVQSVNSKPASDSPARLLQMIIVAGILPTLALLWILTLGFRFNVANTMIVTYFN